MMENSSQPNSSTELFLVLFVSRMMRKRSINNLEAARVLTPPSKVGFPTRVVTIAGRRDERALGIRNCFGDFTASRHPACQVYWAPFCLGFHSACSAVHGAYVRLTKRLLIEDRCPIHAAEPDMSFVVNMT